MQAQAILCILKQVMLKNKNNKDSWWFWFSIGLSACLLAAPNPTIIKILVSNIEPMEFTFLRSVLVVLISLPFVLLAIRKFNRRNLALTLGSSLCMTIAIISFSYAVKYSSASYVVVMSLLSPILLVVLSSKLMHDKISFRAASGVTLAAAGALLIVLAPLVVSGSLGSTFYPLATTLMLINSVLFTLSVLFTRKSHEEGMPLTANTGITAFAVAVASFLGMIAVGEAPTNIFTLSSATWLGIFYSGVVVVFIARVMSIASYERIGSATTSGLSYLGTVVGVTIPVLFLGEELSSTIVVGGIIILLGVYLTEKRQINVRRFGFLRRG